MDKNFAKVRLSAEEMRLVADPAWILTKNSVMGKVVAMFAELSEEWRERPFDGTVDLRSGSSERGLSGTGPLPAALPVTEPKISKGENYKGLPWVMLDYPRIFGREDVCAIRTFFWWGHAFSVTLHLKGVYREVFLPVIMDRREELSAAGFGWGISDDEWAHEHTQETYGLLHERPFEKRPFEKRPVEGPVDNRSANSEPGLGSDPVDLRSGSSVPGLTGVGDERSWFKLSARCGLNRWEEAPELLTGWHSMLMRVLTAGDHGLSGDARGLSGDDHR